MERIRTLGRLKSIDEMTYLIITPAILLAISRDLDNYYCRRCISVSNDNRCDVYRSRAIEF